MPRSRPLRLHNAHNVVRLKTNIQPQFTRLPSGSRSPIPINWRQTLRQDVVNFIDKAKIPITQLPKILDDPAKFLSRPSNVPLHARKQVFLPNVVVSLLRTPHLPPKYASFYVPLWFNKFDMKDFLSRVYNVSVLHVRSYVEQQPVSREMSLGSGPEGGRGRLKRPTSKKKMTVELEKPFVWPEEVTDFEAWEKKHHDMATKESYDDLKIDSSQGRLPLKRERRIIAEQAKALLNGEAKWRPSWQAMPIDDHLLQGKDSSAHFGP